MRKKYFFLILLILLDVAYALDYKQAHGNALSSSQAETGIVGNQWWMNTTSGNMLVTRFVKASSDTSTRVAIYSNATVWRLASATFVGDTATLSIPFLMTRGSTYIIAVDNAGSFTNYYTAATTPKADTLGIWQDAAYVRPYSTANTIATVGGYYQGIVSFNLTNATQPGLEAQFHGKAYTLKVAQNTQAGVNYTVGSDWIQIAACHSSTDDSSANCQIYNGTTTSAKNLLAQCTFDRHTCTMNLTLAPGAQIFVTGNGTTWNSSYTSGNCPYTDKYLTSKAGVFWHLTNLVWSPDTAECYSIAGLTVLNVTPTFVPQGSLTLASNMVSRNYSTTYPSPYVLTYNGTLGNGATDETFNCTLFNNGLINSTTTDTNISKLNNFTITWGERAETILYNISCNQTTGVNSTTATFTYDIDTINPTITAGAAFVNNSQYSRGQTNMAINVTCGDTNLFACNVTIQSLTPAGAVNNTLNNTFVQNIRGNTSHQVNLSIDLLRDTRYTPGKYQIIADAWDTHTAKTIDNYVITPFLINGNGSDPNVRGATIDGIFKVYSSNFTDVKFAKKTDRYVFNMTFNQQDPEFFVSCPRISYIDDSTYSGHFVCLQANKWFDLVDPVNVESVEVTTYDYDIYKVKIHSFDPDQRTFVFNSIGDLNNATQIWYFNVTGDVAKGWFFYNDNAGSNTDTKYFNGVNFTAPASGPSSTSQDRYLACRSTGVGAYIGCVSYAVPARRNYIFNITNTTITTDYSKNIDTDSNGDNLAGITVLNNSMIVMATPATQTTNDINITWFTKGGVFSTSQLLNINGSTGGKLLVYGVERIKDTKAFAVFGQVNGSSNEHFLAVYDGTQWRFNTSLTTNANRFNPIAFKCPDVGDICYVYYTNYTSAFAGNQLFRYLNITDWTLGAEQEMTFSNGKVDNRYSRGYIRMCEVPGTSDVMIWSMSYDGNNNAVWFRKNYTSTNPMQIATVGTTVQYDTNGYANDQKTGCFVDRQNNLSVIAYIDAANRTQIMYNWFNASNNAFGYASMASAGKWTGYPSTIVTGGTIDVVVFADDFSGTLNSSLWAEIGGSGGACAKGGNCSISSGTLSCPSSYGGGATCYSIKTVDLYQNFSFNNSNYFNLTFDMPTQGGQGRNTVMFMNESPLYSTSATGTSPRGTGADGTNDDRFGIYQGSGPTLEQVFLPNTAPTGQADYWTAGHRISYIHNVSGYFFLNNSQVTRYGANNASSNLLRFIGIGSWESDQGGETIAIDNIKLTETRTSGSTALTYTQIDTMKVSSNYGGNTTYLSYIDANSDVISGIYWDPARVNFSEPQAGNNVSGTTADTYTNFYDFVPVDNVGVAYIDIPEGTPGVTSGVYIFNETLGPVSGSPGITVTLSAYARHDNETIDTVLFEVEFPNGTRKNLTATKVS